MRMLETERIFLKPVEEADLEELLNMQWDRKLMTYMNFKPLTFENQKEWLKSLGKTSLAFTIFLKTADKVSLVGLATLNQIDQLHQRTSWGMKLKSDLQSKGIGLETSLILLHYGFSIMNMHKIHGDILVENIANRKMCEKIGASEEGVLRGHYYQNGGFRDVVLVGILKEEFYKSNNEALKNLGLL